MLATIIVILSLVMAAFGLGWYLSRGRITGKTLKFIDKTLADLSELGEDLNKLKMESRAREAELQTMIEEDEQALQSLQGVLDTTEKE